MKKRNPFREFITDSEEITRDLGHPSYSSPAHEKISRHIDEREKEDQVQQDEPDDKESLFRDFVNQSEMIHKIQAGTEDEETLTLDDELRIRGARVAEAVLRELYEKLAHISEEESKEVRKRLLTESEQESGISTLEEEGKIIDFLVEDLFSETQDPETIKLILSRYGIERDHLIVDSGNSKKGELPMAFTPDAAGFELFLKVVHQMRRYGALSKLPNGDELVINELTSPEQDWEVNLDIGPFGDYIREEFPPEMTSNDFDKQEGNELDDVSQTKLAYALKDVTGASYIREVLSPQLEKLFNEATKIDEDSVPRSALRKYKAAIGYPTFILCLDLYERMIDEYLNPNFGKEFAAQSESNKDDH